MGAHQDLQVDTALVRQAAATLRDTGTEFLSIGRAGTPAVNDVGLGSGGSSTAIAALVNLRCAQAVEAAGQLGAVAAGLADKLEAVAQTFDRLERLLGGPR